jgi:glycosyltransferase involved in cell wall biosynthesis
MITTTRAGSQRAAQPGFEIALVASMVAGIQTQYSHFRAACEQDGTPILAVEVKPYREAGWIERLPLPSTVRGTLRSVAGTAELFAMRGAPAVWTQVGIPLLPFALTRGAWGRVPIFYTSDSTPRLLAGFAGHYRITDPSTVKGRIAARANRIFFSRCRGLIPWSRWAARSMIEDYGAHPDKVQVIPPGVDTLRWRPAEKAADASRDRVQLLFVGADFERKGGPLLLSIFRDHLRDSCELHLVTRAAIEREPGVEVYRDLGPDDERLLELYRRSDVVVIPTLADCFSMAAIEAMACGLPVVISATGGTPEIVDDGRSGSLVAPGDGRALLQALDTLIKDAGRRRSWGSAGRAIADLRFDAAQQSARVLALIADAAGGAPKGDSR